MKSTGKLFGGDWTQEKLSRVGKYLSAYTKIMSKKNYRFAYIDAFAGTGYIRLEDEEEPNQLLLPELAEDETQKFLKGSAHIALQVRPRFEKYIFIEKDKSLAKELDLLRKEFPEMQEDIEIKKFDANTYLQDLCQNKNWEKHRAVLFLDPYGMQVTWETIKAIGLTKAIDLWILFPLGVAVNRLLRKDGHINEGCKRKLDTIFGTTDWFSEFYKPMEDVTLFGSETQMKKVVDLTSIGQYFVNRLKTVFPGVANNPLALYNSRNNPLYLLCFAAGNKNGARTAIKIAQDILGGEKI